jgi:hypothetical protein
MISKVDFRDFFEINARLYGETPAKATGLDYVLGLLDTLESRRAELGMPVDDLRRH